MESTVADNMAVLEIGKLTKYCMIDPNAVQAFAEKGCRQGQIMARPNQQMVELSAGNIQKVILQRELFRPFSLLFLADPFTGLDKNAGQQLVQNLKTLAKNGAAILILASDIDEVLAVADRIAVLSRGELSQPKAAADWDRDEAAALMVVA